jgi:hypothetical protein
VSPRAGEVEARVAVVDRPAEAAAVGERRERATQREFDLVAESGEVLAGVEPGRDVEGLRAPVGVQAEQGAVALAFDRAREVDDALQIDAEAARAVRHAQACAVLRRVRMHADLHAWVRGELARQRDEPPVFAFGLEVDRGAHAQRLAQVARRLAGAGHLHCLAREARALREQDLACRRELGADAARVRDAGQREAGIGLEGEEQLAAGEGLAHARDLRAEGPRVVDVERGAELAGEGLGVQAADRQRSIGDAECRERGVARAVGRPCFVAAHGEQDAGPPPCVRPLRAAARAASPRARGRTRGGGSGPRAIVSRP